MTRLSERRTPSDDCSHAVPGHCRQQPSAPPVNRGAAFLLAANGRHFAEYPAVRPKRRTRHDRMAARSRERTTPSGTCEACQKPAIRPIRRMAVRHPADAQKVPEATSAGHQLTVSTAQLGRSLRRRLPVFYVLPVPRGRERQSWTYSRPAPPSSSRSSSPRSGTGSSAKAGYSLIFHGPAQP